MCFPEPDASRPIVQFSTSIYFAAQTEEYAEIEVVDFVGDDGSEGSTRLTGTVVFADLRYNAQTRSGGPTGQWTVRERDLELPDAFVNPMSRLLPITSGSGFFGGLSVPDGGYFDTLVEAADAVEASLEKTTDDGSVWTLEHEHEAGDFVLVYGVHPDGYLRSFSVTRSDRGDPAETTTTRLPEPSSPVSVTVQFRVLSEPEPIQPPEPGTVFDPSEFDLPDGFLDL